MRRARLRRLIAAGAVVEAGPGRYYLDEGAYAAWCAVARARMRRAAYAGAVLALVLGLFLLLLAR
jgi:hypothetical protein